MNIRVLESQDSAPTETAEKRKWKYLELGESLMKSTHSHVVGGAINWKNIGSVHNFWSNNLASAYPQGIVLTP